MAANRTVLNRAKLKSSRATAWVTVAAVFAGWAQGFVGATVNFVDETLVMGITHRQKDRLASAQSPYWQSSLTGGAAAGDYDGDGWVDLVATRHDDPPILYRNLGGVTFENVTVASGLGSAQPEGSNGAAWGDVDNDGDLDLYLTAFEDTRYYLYINDGAGHFTEEGNERGASLLSDDLHFGQSVAFGDYDRDGYLDIFVTEWRHNNGVQNPNGGHSHNRLLRNVGATRPGHFTDVTVEAGVSVDSIEGDRLRDGSWGFTPRFSDLDGDGWPDLVIAADFEESVLFWNNGDGTFTDGSIDAGVRLEDNGMGATTGDFNGDGLLDWFVTSIFEAGSFLYTGNRMYYNNGDRTFDEVTDAAGVRNGFWGWGTTGLDFDNDGDLDLVETNGYHEEGNFDKDRLRLWDNSGAGEFLEVAATVGLTDKGLGKGILTLDLDNDGDLDIYVANHGGPQQGNQEHPVLYRNGGGNANSWLRIRTIGTLSNRDGIGAFITLTPDTSAPDAFMVREIDGGSNFLSQNEMIAHFGLGVLSPSSTVDRVEVRWPSGVVQVLEDQPINRVLEIVEPSSYGTWQSKFFDPEEIVDPLEGAATADPDHDGISNFHEYAFNRNPRAAEPDALTLQGRDSSYGGDGANMTLTYTRRKEPTDILYAIELSGNLTDWDSGSFSSEEIAVVDDGNFVTETVTVKVIPAIADIDRVYARVVAVEKSSAPTRESSP
jgi:hypothetical protein